MSVGRYLLIGWLALLPAPGYAQVPADSLEAEANWRTAIELSESASALTARSERRRRDSLNARAEAHARRAFALDSTGVWPAFALGLVLGNTALTKGIKARVRMAVEVRELALRALAADSTHDGVHHLLGRWHAEVRRLSGVERLIAKKVLGGGVFGQASWEEARAHLERAVALDSTRIFHRLDLAAVCLDLKDYACAEVELRQVIELPERVAMDAAYKLEGTRLRGRLRPPRT
jgi:tetratricopeptide (TPR) repeat protein